MYDLALIAESAPVQERRKAPVITQPAPTHSTPPVCIRAHNNTHVNKSNCKNKNNGELLLLLLPLSSLRLLLNLGQYTCAHTHKENCQNLTDFI